MATKSRKSNARNKKPTIRPKRDYASMSLSDIAADISRQVGARTKPRYSPRHFIGDDPVTTTTPSHDGLEPKKEFDYKEFKLHPYQVEIYHDPHRFKVVRAGTKFGKTVLCLPKVCEWALGHEGGISWWVAPVSWQTRMAYRRVKGFFPHGAFRARDSELSLFWGNGHVTMFRSGDEPDNLYGENVGFAVADEAARCKDDALVALRTTLTATQGGCWYISTPNGKGGLFYEYCLQGESDDAVFRDWRHWHFSSYDNPYLERSEIEEARASMSERKFREQYLAEFVDDGGEVFRGVREIVQDVLAVPMMGRRYVVGVDLARRSDWTVLTVMDVESGAVHKVDRFNQIDWGFQVARIKSVAKEWNDALCHVELNSPGEPIVDRLRHEGVKCEGFYTTAGSKADLIEDLMLAIEHREITIPNFRPLIEELEAYEFKKTRTGRDAYSAPAGRHDDCVISLALANRKRMKGGGRFDFERLREKIRVVGDDLRPITAGIDRIFG